VGPHPDLPLDRAVAPAPTLTLEPDRDPAMTRACSSMGRLTWNQGCSRTRPSVTRSAGSAFSIRSSRFMQSALIRSDAGTLMKVPASRCAQPPLSGCLT